MALAAISAMVYRSTRRLRFSTVPAGSRLSALARSRKGLAQSEPLPERSSYPAAIMIIFSACPRLTPSLGRKVPSS